MKKEYCYRGQRVIVAQRSNLWMRNPTTQSGMPGKGQQGFIRRKNSDDVNYV